MIQQTQSQCEIPSVCAVDYFVSVSPTATHTNTNGRQSVEDGGRASVQSYRTRVKKAEVGVEKLIARQFRD